MARFALPVPRKAVAGLVMTSAMLYCATAAATDLRVERLTWAGVKLSTERTTVLIDAVGRDLWEGNAPQGLVPVEADTARRYALVTHLHNDHFDEETLKAVLGERGYVICHEDEASHVASRGLRVIPARPYVPVMRAGFTFTALPAEDGFGDKQVSWLIVYEGVRILHAGDTLWHGRWSNYGKQFGPLDVAFVPINGARVEQTPMPETGAVMTPVQAVDAALLLQAQSTVPIHFGLDDPPFYTEVEDALNVFLAQAQRRGLVTQALLPGEVWTNPASDPVNGP